MTYNNLISELELTIDNYFDEMEKMLEENETNSKFKDFAEGVFETMECLADYGIDVKDYVKKYVDYVNDYFNLLYVMKKKNYRNSYGKKNIY